MTAGARAAIDPESVILAGSPPVEVGIRRLARARRISLRVSSLDGRVTLTIPPRVRLAEGLAFLRQREDWIRAALARGLPPTALVAGVTFPLEGRPVTLTEARVPAIVAAGDALLVPPGAARLSARLSAFLRGLALRRLEAACERHALAVARRPARIALRDTRSRWGSCTVDGRLMFSWRLILAPPEVLDYVAAHEVAHLVQMNHGPEFWRLVTALCPDQARHRRWLAEQGAGLHAWRV